MVWQDIGTTKPGFIVEDDVIDEIEDDDDEQDDLFDSVCAICDNGGDILWYAFLFFFPWAGVVCLFEVLFSFLHLFVIQL